MALVRKLRFVALATSVSMLGMVCANAAHAQDAAAADDSDGKEIVVTGIRASLAASLDSKRKSDMVSEVVTAQEIGKFPDKNVADSLGRLTGVNVVTGSSAAGGFGENQNISIRGTDPSLNLTLYDGHGIATGDWFVLDQTAGGRSFDFSLLPSEIVGKLEVYKASQADLVEGGVGGTVNIHSRKPLDLRSGTVSLTAQANYNDLARKWTPQISGLVSWKNEAGTFGLLASGFYQEREFRRDGQEFLGYSSYANWAGTTQTVIAPNLIGSAYFTQKRVRKGGTVALQFQPSDKFELRLNGLYSKMDADNVNRNSMAWISRLANGNSTVGPNNALGAYTVTNGYLTSASWANTTTGGAAVNGRVQDDIFRKALSSTWDINADMTFKVSDKLTVTTQLGYTEGKGETTDTFAWETYWDTGVSYTLGNRGATVSYPGITTSPTSAAYLNNFYSWSWGGHITSPDREFYAKIDADFAIDGDFLKSIKIGGRFTNHRRALDYVAYAWAGNGLYSGTSTVDLGTVFTGGVTPANFGNGLNGATGYSFADQDAVLAVLATQGGRNFAFYPQASFSVKEQTGALYAMARFDNDSSWRGNLGVRAIHTDLEATQYSPTAPVANATSIFCGTCGSVETKRGYWDILPSLNMTYIANDKLQLRFGAAKVMARPGYAQLAGAFTASDLALTANAGGNPDLKPFRAWNFNLGAEFYYAPKSLLAVNLFYLDIQSYITTATSTRFLITQQNPNGANFLTTGPVNGPGGHNLGFEVNWQQPIAGGFGMLANYTYADAKASGGGTIDGNSKHTFNVTGYFENDLLSARVAYTFRSKFRSGIDRSTPMWQDDFGTLDASLVVNVTKNIALTADAQNLTNSKLYYFVGDPSIPRALYNNGRTFWVGARAKF